MKKKRTLQILRYIAAVTFAFTIGLVLMQAVQTDAETDRQIEQIDRFIEAHEVRHSSTILNKDIAEPETVQMATEEETTEDVTTSIGDTDSTWDMDGTDGDYGYGDPVVETASLTITPEEFMQAGIIDWNGWRYTYYSEQVLPGGGLEIPGRWSDGQFVRDENGYLCVASNEVPYGSVMDTPFGQAIVYDSIGDGVTGICDIYVSW